MAEPALRRIVAATGESAYLSRPGPARHRHLHRHGRGHPRGAAHQLGRPRHRRSADLAVGGAPARLTSARAATSPSATASSPTSPRSPRRSAGPAASPARSACSARPIGSTTTAMRAYGRIVAAARRPPSAAQLGPSAQYGSTTAADRRGDHAMIRFDSVTKTYPDGTVAVDELEPRRAVGPDHRLRRSVRLRQDDQPAHDQPDDRADRRARSGIDDRDTSKVVAARAAARHRLRHPARRAVPAPHRRRQRRDRAVPARAGQEARRARGRWSCSSGSGLDPRASPSATRPSCPAASSSASASPARWPPTRR